MFTITVGGVSMIRAFTSWWKGPLEATTKAHLGCMINFTKSKTGDRGPAGCRKPLATCTSAPSYKDPRKSIALSVSRLEAALGRAYDPCSRTAGSSDNVGGGMCVESE